MPQRSAGKRRRIRIRGGVNAVIAINTGPNRSSSVSSTSRQTIRQDNQTHGRSFSGAERQGEGDR